MEEYFHHILKSLTIEDVSILGILYDEDANSKVKAIKSPLLYGRSDTSEAKYRKVIGRLTSLNFIEINSDYKEHSLFITEYGKKALELTIENMKGCEVQ